MADAEPLRIVVVHCAPGAPRWREIEVPPRTTILEAIRRSGLVRVPGALLPDGLEAAVYNRARRLDEVVQDGDRIELLRPLRVDPKEARRARAAVKQRRAAGG